jgi:hypothetical protein
MIYADEAEMMRYCFGEEWPRYLDCLHEICEQIYAQRTGLDREKEAGTATLIDGGRGKPMTWEENS